MQSSEDIWSKSIWKSSKGMFTWEVLTCKSKTYKFKTCMFFLFTHKTLSYVILFTTNIQINKLKQNGRISLCLIIIARAALRIRRDRRRPRQWTRPWIHRQRQLGTHHALIKELASEDPQSYTNFITMHKPVVFYTFQ